MIILHYETAAKHSTLEQAGGNLTRYKCFYRRGALGMAKKKVDPLQLADEASRATQKQAGEVTKAMEADISPFWDSPEGKRKKSRNSVRARGSLITGGFTVPEPYKEEETDEKNTIKIVFGTSGQYPDGTSWERDATEEEIAKYESWSK